MKKTLSIKIKANTMKKLFITAIVAVSLSVSVNSQTVVDYIAVERFEENFTDAPLIHDAFYNLDGDAIATTISIDEEELPASVKAMLQKKYAGFNVTEAFELKSDDANAYFISAKKGHEKVTVRVAGDSISL